MKKFSSIAAAAALSSIALFSAAAKSAADVADSARASRTAALSGFREACRRAGQDVRSMSVGLASSMAAVRPKDDILPAVPLKGVSVSLAKGEKESVQIVVVPGAKGLANVRVETSGLKTKGSLFGLFQDSFGAENIDSSVVGYVETTNMPPYYAGFWKEDGARSREQAAPGWWPDPILDFMHSTDVAPDIAQSFWIRVKCPRGQKSGLYRGTLSVVADGARPLSVPFSVRVREFSVPEQSPLPLAVTFSPPETCEAGKASKSRTGEWGDFLADYYITMDSLYGRGKADWNVLSRLADEGRLGRFNLGYWGPLAEGAEAEAKWRSSTLEPIKEAYAKAKEHSLLGRAYCYGCDEAQTNTFENVERAAAILRREIPGVPIMTTAFDDSLGAASALRSIDIFVPLTRAYDRTRADAARKEGREVWWYICCVPSAPYANMFVECPPIEGRMLMGAQSVRERPDGFLYYQTAAWKKNACIKSGPFTGWDPCSWGEFHGDGCWTCAGPDGLPLATIRLENFRDGLEDYAYAMEVERVLKKLPARKKRSRSMERWADEARRLLEVPPGVVESMTRFTGNPNRLLGWRDALANLLDEAVREDFADFGEGSD